MRYLVFILLFISIGVEAQNINQLRPDTAAGSMPMTVEPYFRQAYARPQTVADTMVRYMSLDTFFITDDSVCLRVFPNDPILCRALPPGIAIPDTCHQTLWAKDSMIFLTYSCDTTVKDTVVLLFEPDTTGAATYVSAGTGISVSGSGSFADPYVITNTHDGSETVVTAGVNISVTGSGTSGSPYVITNTLTAPDGSETVITSGTGINVSGSGTSGSPYVVTNTAIADGSETSVTAGTNVTVTGTGTSGDPYVVNSSGSADQMGATVTANRVLYGLGTALPGNKTGFTFNPSNDFLTVPNIQTGGSSSTAYNFSNFGTSYFLGHIELDGGITDYVGSLGSDGNILVNVGGADVRWKTLSGNSGISVTNNTTSVVIGATGLQWYANADGGTPFLASNETVSWNSGTAINVSKNNSAKTFTINSLYDWDFGLNGSYVSIDDNDRIDFTNTAGISINRTITGTDIEYEFSVSDQSMTNELQNLGQGTRTATTYPITITDGTGTTLQVFSDAGAGMVPGDGGLSASYFLNAGGGWSIPSGGGGIYGGSGTVGGGSSVTASINAGTFFALDYDGGSDEFGVSSAIAFINHTNGVKIGDQDDLTNELLIDGYTGGIRMGNEQASPDSRIGFDADGDIHIVAQEGTNVADINLTAEDNMNFTTTDNFDVDADFVDVTGTSGVLVSSSGNFQVNANSLLGATSGNQFDIRSSSLLSVAGHEDYAQTSAPGLGSQLTIYGDNGFGSDGDLYLNARGESGSDLSLIASENVGIVAGAAGSGVITTTGNFGINGTPGSYALYVNGTQFSTSASTFTTSDKKIKRNIRSIRNPLDKLMQLKPVTYEYKDDYLKSSNQQRKTMKGFIAQDYQKVFAEDVVDNDGTLAIDSQALIPYLVAAVQELRKENDELRKEIQKLKK